MTAVRPIGKRERITGTKNLKTESGSYKNMADEKGFTLIEILVAVTIMGLAYVAVLQNFSMSARNISKMEELRTELLNNALAFEQQLLFSSQEGEAESFAQESVFLEGARYRVVLVSDESQEFVTMVLEAN